MLTDSKAFGGFSVDDLTRARSSMARRSGCRCQTCLTWVV